MIRPVVRSEMLLKAKARDASEADAGLAEDLRDTLEANAERCVGMAANMIGAPVRVIAFKDGDATRVMYNPEVISRSGAFEAEEGCLCLEGTRTATRYRNITVRYQDERFLERDESFEGWTAQIVQHEIDHTNGIVI